MHVRIVILYCTHIMFYIYNISAEFVQVGWGKKETQFHGSEGKSAATKKTEVQTNYIFESLKSFGVGVVLLLYVHGKQHGPVRAVS